MKSILLPIIFFLLIFKCYSQDIKYYSRTYSDTLPDKFRLNAGLIQNHIYKRIPYDYKTGIFKKISYRFSYNVAFEVTDLVSSGSLYSDWADFEKYINDILQKIIPKELEKDTVIHAYLIQEGGFNAFMTPAGHMCLNIGLFRDIYTEATLAGILAHELAHYYLQHSLNAYIQESTGQFVDGILVKESAENKYSVKSELEADSLAMLWMMNSHYNLNGLVHTFKLLEHLDNIMIGRSKSDFKIERTTHPLSDQRIDKLNTFLKKNKNKVEADFLVSETKFSEFKEAAKPEILKHLLNNFRYTDCIETAFKFHLFDPDNMTYIYYLLESIRRKCYINNSLWGKNFITNEYYKTNIEYGMPIKVEYYKHVFEKLDFEIMPLLPYEAKYIKAKFYWQEEPKFKTYEEAFEFYFKLSENLGCNECVLSNALSHTKDTAIRNSYLKEYLKFDNIKHRKFAKNLLNNKIYDGIENKKLLVFNDVTTRIRLGNDDVPIYIQITDSLNELKQIFDSVIIKFPNRIPVFLPHLKTSKLNTYRMLNELMRFSIINTYAQGERTKLHILDPRYIDVFYEHGVNEIEFINCLYFESRKAEESIDAYNIVLNSTYNNILSKTKRSRYLEVFISSVREIENSVMKTRYYNRGKLKYKDTGYNQMARELKYQLRKKELYDETLNYN